MIVPENSTRINTFNEANTTSSIATHLFDSIDRSVYSLEPNQTSRYTPEQLERIICPQKNASMVLLDRMKLNCEDMKVVANYLLQHNKVRMSDRRVGLSSFIIQTIRVLNLEMNQIGVQGIQYLTNALQNNKVKEAFFSSFYYSF
jgi:hypothetical protein